MKRIFLLALLLAAACSAAGSSTTVATTASAGTTTELTSTTALVSTTAGATGSSPTSVGVSDFAFSPSSVTVQVGDSVAWTLTDGTHTSTSGAAPDGDGLWSETLDANAPFSFTFGEPGEYPYFCRFHPDFMTGMVIVEP